MAKLAISSSLHVTRDSSKNSNFAHVMRSGSYLLAAFFRIHKTYITSDLWPLKIRKNGVFRFFSEICFWVFKGISILIIKNGHNMSHY